VTEGIGVIVIGRNEGQRLSRCLESVLGQCATVVYVDSGSTDDSEQSARNLGVKVVQLDMSVPFTAARARNEGFAQLMAIAPQTRYAQFVDGDCQIVSSWLEIAREQLDRDANVAVVCGRRRELDPDESIYNRLCDIEWNTPIGETDACGGDAMIRVSALRQVNGYDPSIIAGEEPELCARLRQHGWKVMRVDADMTHHDAAMTRFSQWWVRMIRAGHSYAQAITMHGRGRDRYGVRETQSIWLWALVIPSLAILLAWSIHGLSVLLLLGYPMLMLRIVVRKRRTGLARRHAILYAGSCILGKFPQLLGQIKFLYTILSGQQAKLIEHKR